MTLSASFVRRACAAAVLGAIVSAAGAQAPAPGAAEAAPPPGPGTVALLSQAYGGQFAPRAAAFADESQRFTAAADALCDGPADAGAAGLASAQSQWQRTATAWDRLAGVAVGPLVRRRALTALDFHPTRPATIERAIKVAPATPQQMERIGTPAKGLPTLEWLLWRAPPVPLAPQSPACRYTQQVARDLAREAATLSEGFAAQSRTTWASEHRATFLALQELVNQWLGGVERLRWTQIDRPLKAAESTGKAPAFTRAASGHTAQGWAAHWDALRSLGGPIGAALRARGQAALAGRMDAALAQADAALAAARPEAPATLAPAVQALDGLKQLIEAEAAPALDVVIGFSDGDGD